MNNKASALGSVGRIGLGAWAIGGPYEFGWGSVDDAQSKDAICAAYEHGIEWIDTAPAYGCGHSEKVVGSVVKALSGAIKVFTKCGRTWDATGKVSSDLRPVSIRDQWEQSVERLGVETIDLYQIHRPDNVTGTPLANSWEELARLRADGKVKAIGLCNVTLDQYRLCAQVSRVDALQMPVNILRPGDAELRLTAENDGAVVLAYSPMESGLLTGAFSEARMKTLASDDWRKTSSKFSQAALSRANLVVAALKEISDKTGHSVAALAVAWALKQPGVSAAIVGVRRRDQIVAWESAASIALDESEWAEIDRLAGV